MRSFSKVLSLVLFAVLFVISPLLVSAAEDVKPYLVSKDNGPWFISVYVFTDINSELAADQAVRLTKELRENFKLPAYIYVKETGEGKTMEGRPYYVVDPNNPDAKPQISTTYHYLNPSASQEFAVLVGNFASVEDPRAAKALAQIKTLQPKCLANTPSRNPADPNNLQPLSRAFMTSNPLLPRDFFVSPGLDPVVLAANKDIKRYSLLDCPGKYTVQVAVLKGVTTLNQQRIAEIQANDAKGLSIKGQTLSDADEKAIMLCDGLRAKGYEAYVFRDRYASIVTIGSFDSVGSEVNGQFTFRPEILQIIKTFSASTDPTQAGVASIKRKTLAQIPGGKAPKKEAANILFDPMPRVVQAPKRPVLK